MKNKIPDTCVCSWLENEACELMATIEMSKDRNPAYLVRMKWPVSGSASVCLRCDEQSHFFQDCRTALGYAVQNGILSETEARRILGKTEGGSR